MIVVTGASGFIGSNLILELIKRGETDILAVDFIYRDYLKDLPVIFSYADYFYENIDYYKENISMIFHEGAISSTIETDWKSLFHKNVNCSWELIYYCRTNNIPLQYASSASVYGNPSKEEWSNPNKETAPLNLYAKSKQQVDYVADLVIKSRKPPKLLQGLRYFNVYGPNEEHKGDQSSPYNKFTSQLNEYGKIKLFEGSVEYYRDFISVDNVINTKLKLIKENDSGIYDVGTGIPKSFYDVAKEVCIKKGIENPEQYIEWIPMQDNLKEHYQKYSCAILDYIK
jgi:ADP-L-glycero-D-manno-heptose 6-epimerase